MKRASIKHLLAAALLAGSSAALACADGGCEGGYNLIGKSYSCQGRGMLSPGNDSRMNLMFLLADRGGRSTAGMSYPADGYDYNGLGHVFVDWRMLRGALFNTPLPDYSAETPAYEGSRCQSYASGTAALDAAMQANRALPAGERTALLAARAGAEAVCKQATAWERRYGEQKGKPLDVFSAWPAVGSAAGREFLGYIQAADAFYGERFVDARNGFAALAKANDPFVRETAAYMTIRVEFAASQAAAFDEYGGYDGGDKIDRSAAKRGVQALSAYLGAYPKGRYTASAAGLVRRGLWLMGDYPLLGKTYVGMLNSANPAKESAADLVEEIDTKLLFDRNAKDGVQGPMLLATQDLIAMRDESYGEDAAGKPSLTAAALDAQAPRFAGQQDLFTFLQATHAFYYGKDYRRVLQLVPDQAKQSSYSNLAFSRQVLRGMALAALKDRNEAGFWQDLIGGARQLWQRPLAELGLAMNWERNGKIDAVFAPGSPITDPTLRSILITNSAGPALLRKVVLQSANSADERDNALNTLLSNQLVRGQYAAFLSDLKLPVAKKDGSARIFVSGKVGDGYPCAPLAVTVAALARNPQDVAGRLCLGDFFRLNSLDYLGGKWDPPPGKDDLGGFAAGFPVQRNYRSDFYTAVIADPRAGANDKAYALYRAVMCYAPSGNNDCGGNDVAKSQRKAWFDRLKRDYPQSSWAKKLRYYW